MKKFLSLVAIVGLVLITTAQSVHAQALADTPLSTRSQPVCNPQGTQPYLVYNITTGLWNCSNIQQPRYVKTLTAVQEARYTTLLTATVPNTAVSAVIHVHVFAALGAGGSVAANECTGSVEADITITRTANLSSAANVSSATLSSSACVAGAQSIQLNLFGGQTSGAGPVITGGTTGSNQVPIALYLTNTNSKANNHTVMLTYYVKNITTAAGLSVQ